MISKSEASRLFVSSGKEMVDYIAGYLADIRSRRVLPDVKPGYMRQLVPDTAPQSPEKWEDIFDDIERVIMPGVSKKQQPKKKNKKKTNKKKYIYIYFFACLCIHELTF